MPKASPTAKSPRKSAAPSKTKAKRSPSKTKGKRCSAKVAVQPPANPPSAEAPTPLSRYERIFVERLIYAGGLDETSWVFAQSNQGGPSVYPPEECKRLFALPHIQREYQERLAEESLENARQIVLAKRLHDPEFLDANAAQNILFAEPGSKKTSALELGYTIVGVLAKRELADPLKKESAPNIYRALQTTTVQRVTETITQTTEVPTPEQAPALIAPKEPKAEILDY